MARRGMTGQLNMFDFFNSLDVGEPGEVEMVSLVPDFDEEPEVVEEPEIVEALEVEDVLETVEVSEVEEEIEVKEENIEPEEVAVSHDVKLQSQEKVAMSRTYELDGKSIEIAYINYNKVRITRGKETPIIKEFASTKEAVDYYVEQMQELEADE